VLLLLQAAAAAKEEEVKEARGAKERKFLGNQIILGKLLLNLPTMLLLLLGVAAAKEVKAARGAKEEEVKAARGAKKRKLPEPQRSLGNPLKKNQKQGARLRTQL
jgi:hypothetical protein